MDAAAKTVTLTLARAVTGGQTVTVSYADPTSGNDANAMQDQAGNDTAGFTDQAVFNETLNARQPTLAASNAITISGRALTVGETASVTFRFSEAVTGFDAGDVIALNATLSNLQAIDASGNAIGGSNPASAIWRATLTPAANVQDTSNALRVDLAGVRNPADNEGAGLSAASENYTVNTLADAVRPTLEITVSYASVGATVLGIGATATVSFTFSEAVTGFDRSKVTLPAGLDALTSSDGGVHWPPAASPLAKPRWARTTRPRSLSRSPKP